MNKVPLRFAVLEIILAFFAFAACEPADPVPGGGASDKLKITGNRTITLPSDAATATIAFTATAKWTAELANDRPADWISVSPASGGKGEAAVTVTIMDNDAPDERSAVIKITCGGIYETVKVVQKQKDMITLTPSANEFPAAGGTFTVNVKSNIAYTFEVNGSDWIINSGTRALTGKTTAFTISPNGDTRRREGSVTVKSDLGNETYTIYQAGADPIIVLSTSSVPMPTAGGSFQVEVSSNVTVEMQVTSGEEWLTEDKTRTMSSHTYFFNVAANPDPDARTGEITFTSRETGLAEKVTVTQMQKDALVVAPDLMEIGAAGGTLDIAVSYNTDFQIEIAENWISRILPTKAMVTDVLNFEVQPNETYDIRENEITFTAGDIVQKVTVRQDAAKGYIPGFKSDYTVSASEGTLLLSASSNVPLEAVSQTEWIRVAEGTRGLEARTIVLEIAANPDANRRTGKVAVNAPSLDLTDTVTVVQIGAGEIFIPDEGFRAYCLEKFDGDGDGSLSEEERNAVKEMSIPLGDLIGSLVGVEFFPNLSNLTIYDSTMPEADFSKNPEMSSANFYGCENLQRVAFDSPQLISLTFDGCRSLKTLSISEKSRRLNLVRLIRTAVTTLDLSMSYVLSTLWIEDTPMADLTLRTGTGEALNASAEILSGVTIHYVGEDMRMPYQFVDPMVKRYLIWKKFDLNQDNELSNGELFLGFEGMKKFYALQADIDEWLPSGEKITSLEDVANLPFESVGLLNLPKDKFYASLAPLTGSKTLNYLYLENCSVSGDIPSDLLSIPTMEETVILTTFPRTESGYATLADLFDLPPFGYVKVCSVTEDSLSLWCQEISPQGKIDYMDVGGLTFPAGFFGQITKNPAITQLTLEGSSGPDPVPDELILSPDIRYLVMVNCDFPVSRVTLPPSELLKHPVRDMAYAIYTVPQRDLAKPGLIYRSTVDGTAPVHADGEAVLYNRATVGNGVNIAFTGDGFTAENNTVGGTLETYLKHAADCLLSMPPYDRMKDYLNIWLVYAHSNQEGIGSVAGDTKYRSLVSGAWSASTYARGDMDAVRQFVSNATGVPSDDMHAINVIQNSPEYAGTCYYFITLGSITVSYQPVSCTFEQTLLHEFGGHGMAYLGDEYSLQNNLEPGETPSPLYHELGMALNIDDTSDPAAIRWAPFLADPRYQWERLGIFEGARYYMNGFYRPRWNSIMRAQWEQDGDTFNAPSREAIYLWLKFLSTRENGTYPYASWDEFMATYNREDFVTLDLSPTPVGALRPPMRKSALPDDRARRNLPVPVHHPPVIMTR